MENECKIKNERVETYLCSKSDSQVQPFGTIPPFRDRTAAPARIDIPHLAVYQWAEAAYLYPGQRLKGRGT